MRSTAQQHECRAHHLTPVWLLGLPVCVDGYINWIACAIMNTWFLVPYPISVKFSIIIYEVDQTLWPSPLFLVGDTYCNPDLLKKVKRHRVFYLILVYSIWLEGFVFVSSWDVLVNKCWCITGAVVSDVLRPAVQLIMKDSPIWLRWRGPGEQKGGL